MQILNPIKANEAIEKTRYFKLNELACKCCGLALIDDLLPPRLDKLRELFGHPIHINSGYRCLTHNTAVGGKSASRHMLGQAVDIDLSEYTPYQVYSLIKLAYQLEFGGIELPSRTTKVLHIDIRPLDQAWIGNYP